MVEEEVEVEEEEEEPEDCKGEVCETALLVICRRSLLVNLFPKAISRGELRSTKCAMLNGLGNVYCCRLMLSAPTITAHR